MHGAKVKYRRSLKGKPFGHFRTFLKMAFCPWCLSVQTFYLKTFIKAKTLVCKSRAIWKLGYHLEQTIQKLFNTKNHQVEERVIWPLKALRKALYANRQSSSEVFCFPGSANTRACWEFWCQLFRQTAVRWSTKRSQENLMVFAQCSTDIDNIIWLQKRLVPKIKKMCRKSLRIL